MARSQTLRSQPADLLRIQEIGKPAHLGKKITTNQDMIV